MANPAPAAAPGNAASVGFRHFKEPPHGLALIDTLAMDGRIDGQCTVNAVTGHGLDVAACAKAFPRSGQNHALYRRAELRPGELFGQSPIHRLAHRIARLGPVKGERQHTIIQYRQEIGGAGARRSRHDFVPRD